MRQQNNATGRDTSRWQDAMQQWHAQVDVTTGRNVEMQREDTTTNRIKSERAARARRVPKCQVQYFPNSEKGKANSYLVPQNLKRFIGTSR